MHRNVFTDWHAYHTQRKHIHTSVALTCTPGTRTRASPISYLSRGGTQMAKNSIAQARWYTIFAWYFAGVLAAGCSQERPMSKIPRTVFQENKKMRRSPGWPSYRNAPHRGNRACRVPARVIFEKFIGQHEQASIKPITKPHLLTTFAGFTRWHNRSK